MMLHMGILLARALEMIKESKVTEKPFSIDFVTLDRARNTGGRLKRMEGMIHSGSSHDTKDQGTISIKKKDGSGHPIPVHINLILKFNQEPIK